MKKIIVKENQKGLLSKNGKFVKLLEAGKYHLFGDSHAELLSAEGQLTSDTCTLETLLKAPEIARQVSVVEVGDQQMALHFVDGKFVHASDKASIDAFRAYIAVPTTALSTAASRSIDIDFGGTTGINEIQNAQSSSAAAIYDVTGKRVDKNYKGVVIRNGKKMIQK